MAINIPVTSDNVLIVILTAICNVYTLQCRIELRSGLIILKSDLEPVESDTSQNRDPTRPADITD